MLRIHFIKKYFFIVLLLITGMGNAVAQTGSGYFNQAELLFRNKEYYEAAQVYEKYLATEKNSRPRSTPFAIEKKVKGKANLDPHQEAVYQLATCYRMINNYQKAEKYYKESIKFSEQAYPNARYWYAVTLRANKEYAEALVQITAFLEKHTQMDDVMLGADRELEDLKFIQIQSERVNDQFVIEQMKSRDSSASYAVAPRAGDTVVYTGITEEKSKTGQTVYVNTLFESPTSVNPLAGSEPINMASEEGAHEGMATFTHDGQHMFFTRWTRKNGAISSAIYISHRIDTGWSLPVKAPEPLNVAGSNSAQPSLTADGRYLIFSSDRAGGSGGFDLWASSLDTNLESIQVRNLGNVINTSGDEEAPFFHSKTRTLVFSTNGRVGMGGFDIFYAQGNFNLNGWEKPVNIGAPLNSSKDDIYFVSTDEDNVWNTGWVSSDRASECCLAVFSVTENNAQFVNGVVIDCKTKMPLPNTNLTVTDLLHPTRLLGKYISDSAGQFAIQLHNAAHFKISAGHAQYESSELDFNLPSLKSKDSIGNQVICMNAIKNPQDEIEHLMKELEGSSRVGNFAYKKAVLNDSAHDKLDSLTRLLQKYPQMVIQVEGYTDGIGGEKYNLALAQKRVDACIKYLISKGVPADRLEGRAMGKCCPLVPEVINGKDNPAGRAINRRVEYRVLRY